MSDLEKEEIPHLDTDLLGPLLAESSRSHSTRFTSHQPRHLT